MQRTRTAWVGIVSMVAMTVWNGCGGGGGGSTTDAPSDPGGPDVPGEVATDVSADVPAAKCLGKVDAGKTLTLPGLKGPVEVVRDKWGIPHVYASSDEDLFFAQGFVVAQDRIIQMQGMRLITQGRFASTAAAGADDLDTDVYMRLLDFGGVAEKMWATIQKDEPGLKLALESFSAGVSAYIQAALDGKVQKPLEWTYLSHWDPWTPVDTLRIGRLQSWDLSFDFYTDDLTMMKQYQGLKQKLAGTSLDPDKVFADA